MKNTIILGLVIVSIYGGIFPTTIVYVIYLRKTSLILQAAIARSHYHSCSLFSVTGFTRYIECYRIHAIYCV